MTKLDIQKLINYWRSLSDHDWEVMNKLVKNKSYPHALFFLHLSIEKLIKAMIVKVNKDHAPYSHDLPYLFGKAGLTVSEQIIESLRTISSFNMESRYPDQNLKFYRKADRSYTNQWIKEGTKIRTWLLMEFEKK